MAERPDTDESWRELVQREARKFGVYVTDAVADALLWEYTGWPAFWESEGAPEECAAQVRALLQDNLITWQRMFPPPERPPGISVYERLLRREI